MLDFLTQHGAICTGCGACAAACPKAAISMERDDDGFLHARVDRDACVGCEICERTCPTVSPDFSNRVPEDCHATMAGSDDIRMGSYSGGMFGTLAEDVLSRGGAVFGAVWDDDFSAHHEMAETEEDLVPLRKSKYVQSDTRDTFRQAGEELCHGREVLYAGTPCQVAGLRAYLAERGIDRENLLAADIVCHGVASPKAMREYLDDAYGGWQGVKEISFRNKEEHGWGASETVVMRDGTVESSKASPYMDAFNPCLLMGKACETCPFSRLPRQGDLTIGDFWGIGDVRPDLDDGMGTSVVIVNNEAGQKALDRIRGRLRFDEVLPLSEATRINQTILHPYPNHPGRKHFYSMLGRIPFRDLVSRAVRHHYDVGVVGLWYGINYGSALTYYALYELLRDLGYDAVMLPKPNGMWDERFEDPSTQWNRFAWEHYNVFAPYPSRSEYAAANESCDAFVLGSDVVWSYAICGKPAGQFFFLDWALRERRKVAYASSIGPGFGTDPAYTIPAADSLRTFDALSTRERNDTETVSELSGRDDVEHVLDPVFLCGRKHFDRLADEGRDDLVKPGGVFAYILKSEEPERKREIIEMLAEGLGTHYDICGDPNVPAASKRRFGDDIIAEMPITDWVRALRGSRLYVGESYHAMCMCLLFHIPFVMVYPVTIPGFERVHDLLDLLGLSDRCVDGPEPDAEILAIAKSEIDWERVDAILAKEVERSREWLEEAMSKPRKTLSAEDYRHDAMVMKDLARERERREYVSALCMRIADIELKSEMRTEELLNELEQRKRAAAEREADLLRRIEEEKAARVAGDIEAMSVKKSLGRIRDAVLRQLPGRRRREAGDEQGGER